MEKFKAKFIEEANELIDDLEKSLLVLENNPEDEAQIQQVFRIMHTLKGNSSMFGFEIVGEFTHNLETIYDLVRNNELKISKEVLNLTLASIDHLKMLFESDENLTGNLKEEHDSLIQKMEDIAQVKEEISNDKSESEVEFNESVESDNSATYYISFKPNLDLLDNGTNPLYLVDEICDLGKSLVNTYSVNFEKLDDLNPVKVYFGWEVIIATESIENDITDIFIFVEDDCDIEIKKIANENIINDAFIVEFDEKAKEDLFIGIDNVCKLLNVKETTESPAISSEKIVSTVLKGSNVISSIRVSSQKLDQLMNLVSELVTTQARLTLFADKFVDNELVGIAENVQKLSRQLRDIAFNVVLIPIESMMTRFQRLVRDLSNDLGKEVEFIVEGGETELDKKIIEGLADPLMHIIRNSIDHGIETAQVRINDGKPDVGIIHFKAFYSGANVIIQISDDGKGIDPDLILRSAVRKKLIAEDKKLNKKEILDLVFIPGFSTAEKVTDVSGRGVGMDVVKRKIEEIRGEVEIDSEITIGTTLTIKLPLTLSIIDGLLVKLDDLDIILPLSAVDKIYAVEHNKLIGTFNNVIVLDEEQIPFYYLREEFGIAEGTQELEEVIIVKYEEKSIALVVDSVVGEYQAVLKPLGKYYKDLQIFSGATILGDGKVALVMDTNRFIRTNSIDDDHIKR